MVNNDPEQARIEIDLARRTLPNNVDLEQTAGMILRNLGRCDEAVTALKKADALQPREPVVINSLARIYRNLRRDPEADEATARVLKLKPAKETFYERLLQAASPLEARADLGPLRIAVTAEPGDDDDKVSLAAFQLVLALYERNAAGVTQALASFPGPRISYGGFECPKTWFEGIAARGRGDLAGARTAFGLARQELVPLLEANPGNPRILGLLAVADAGLGRVDEAMAEGRRAYEITRRRKLVLSEPLAGYHLAVVYAWTGQQDLAFDLLSQLVVLPAGTHLIFQPTYGDFQLNPIWDSLRADPRFAALTARLGPAKAP